MEPLVSIIIVNWNAEKYLKKCIDSLFEQTYKNFEIIVVDNASTDNSVEFIEKNYPQVHLIKNKKNLGFAEGNNIGITHSKGEHVALFNPDAVAEKNWLEKLIFELENSKKVGGTVGKMMYLSNEFGKDAVFCTWSKINPYSAIPYNFYDNEPKSKVDYLSGAAMVVKKEIIKKIGMLDPGYFLYWEETDWCARMIRAGYDLIYVPTAVAWHAISVLLDSDKKIYFMERNRIRFAIKNFDINYLPLFFISFLGETLFIIARDIRNKNFKRTKIRIQVIGWNISNISKTLKGRKKDFSFLRKNGFIKSYNRSLPLRNIKPKIH